MCKQRPIVTKLEFVGLVLGLSLFLLACEDSSLIAYNAASMGNGMVDKTSASTLEVQAASGATIEFQPQNGQTVNGVAPEPVQIPHLVLHRNGALTAIPERTLVVRVPGLDVPTGGVTVTLSIETQHSDPDLGAGTEVRIPVWRESRRIAGSKMPSDGNTVEFVVEFPSTLTSGTAVISTPTDYFRYRVTITDANDAVSRPLVEQDYAFLMENQVVASLPQVQEMTAGAAPDELVIYYCDMVPYQNSTAEGTTRLHREEVTSFVQEQLAPRMVEAFRAQTDDWGFPWYEEWTSYRSEDGERLGVALSDGQTWFHGLTPQDAHAAISFNVSANMGCTQYGSLTERLMSAFQHELFHNLQRNIALHFGNNGDVAGREGFWHFFYEAPAVLATSVGETQTEFDGKWGEGHYFLNANRFLGDGESPGDLNTRYQDMDLYRSVIYWRFLYEQCGGMQVVRQALVTLYSNEIVDVRTSTDIVGKLPVVMDQALADASCPFTTYRESLDAFARALYALHIDERRCTLLGQPGPCSFYDPNHLYHSPTTSRMIYTGMPLTYDATMQSHPAGIPASFGMDFIEIDLDPIASGQPLTLEIYGAPGAAAKFDVQVWTLRMMGEQRIPVGEAVLLKTNMEGHTLYTLSVFDWHTTQRLAVIITRVDAEERVDLVGAYTFVVRGR